MRKIQVAVHTLYLAILLSISFLVTPNNTIDIFALPKSTLFVTGVIVISVLTFSLKNYFQIFCNDKISIYLSLFALLLLIIPSVTNPFNEERLFGTHGRFNGLLVYVALILSLIIIRITFDAKASRRTLKVGAIANFGVGSYFILQWSGRDIFDWQEVYGDPSSTMGNPNFVSGFLATTTLCYLGFAIPKTGSQRNFLSQITLPIIGICFSITCIALTNSSLGLAALAFALMVILSIMIINKVPGLRKISQFAKWTLSIMPLTLVSATAVFVFWDRLGLNASVSNRLYYWKVSLDAIKERPLQGYGFDTTGDFFRTIPRADRLGPTFGVDSSHNILIDLVSWTGIPLAIVFLVIFLLPLLKSLNMQVSTRDVSFAEKVVTSSVIIFVIQALISVPTIGVNAWGFTLIGILLNFVYPVSNQRKAKKVRFFSNFARGLVISSLLLALPLFSLRFEKDVEFRRAAEIGNASELINIVKKWPQDSYHYLALTHSLYIGNNFFLAREIGKRGLEFNPNYYFLLDEIYRVDNDSKFKEEIFARMKQINALPPK